jgi:hypothetical protein
MVIEPGVLKRAQAAVEEVNACLESGHKPAACLELAAFAMASLTSPEPEGNDAAAARLNATRAVYAALVPLRHQPPSDVSRAATHLLALGFILSQRTADAPLALLRFDAAPVGQARMPDAERELQTMMTELYENRGSLEESWFIEHTARHAAEVLELRF